MRSVETGEVAAQVTGEEPCAAGDVERSGGRKARERRDDLCELLVEPFARAVGVEAAAEVPVVVLRGTAVVVRRGGWLAHGS